jgi:hypothetical protein
MIAFHNAPPFHFDSNKPIRKMELSTIEPVSCILGYTKKCEELRIGKRTASCTKRVQACEKP